MNPHDRSVPLATLADVLLSDQVRPDVAGRLALFEPLVGSWQVVVHNYAPDGAVTETDAEWHFGWALDGRALIDVWISPSRPNRTADCAGEWGMSLRFWDGNINAYRSTWHGPARGWVIPFLARQDGDEIVLESQTHDGLRRWTFSGIGQRGFTWRAEETAANATAPVLRQRFIATRME
jgi:hypothetical protein